MCPGGFDYDGIECADQQRGSNGGNGGGGYATTSTLYRSCKVLTHEIGHLFGIGHCKYYDCLMCGKREPRFPLPLPPTNTIAAVTL